MTLQIQPTLPRPVRSTQKPLPLEKIAETSLDGIDTPRAKRVPAHAARAPSTVASAGHDVTIKLESFVNGKRETATVYDDNPISTFENVLRLFSFGSFVADLIVGVPLAIISGFWLAWPLLALGGLAAGLEIHKIFHERALLRENGYF